MPFFNFDNEESKTDQSVVVLSQNKHLKTISKLVSVFQRYIISLLLYVGQEEMVFCFSLHDMLLLE
jgi:hypothetical protein